MDVVDGRKANTEDKEAHADVATQNFSMSTQNFHPRWVSQKLSDLKCHFRVDEMSMWELRRCISRLSYFEEFDIVDYAEQAKYAYILWG